jgi:hypothetical protein
MKVEFLGLFNLIYFLMKGQKQKTDEGFESYLELVSDCYYGNIEEEEKQKLNQNKTKSQNKTPEKESQMKKNYSMTTLDKLLSPLRSNLVFGKISSH